MTMPAPAGTVPLPASEQARPSSSSAVRQFGARMRWQVGGSGVVVLSDNILVAKNILRKLQNEIEESERARRDGESRERKRYRYM